MSRVADFRGRGEQPVFALPAIQDVLRILLMVGATPSHIVKLHALLLLSGYTFFPKRISN